MPRAMSPATPSSSMVAGRAREKQPARNDVASHARPRLDTPVRASASLRARAAHIKSSGATSPVTPPNRTAAQSGGSGVPGQLRAPTFCDMPAAAEAVPRRLVRVRPLSQGSGLTVVRRAGPAAGVQRDSRQSGHLVRCPSTGAAPAVTAARDAFGCDNEAGRHVVTGQRDRTGGRNRTVPVCVPARPPAVASADSRPADPPSLPSRAPSSPALAHPSPSRRLGAAHPA